MRRALSYPLLLALVFALSLLLRLPTLSQGKPFFYEEDEAHHFNRLVEMVKRGTLDPQYFHKPSLHFYLRMPAVLVGYLLEPRHGDNESIQDIRTRDRYGLAKYSFSWSHPRVVLAARAVSLTLTMLTLLLVFVLSRQLGLSHRGALFAAILYSVSGELYRYSSFIGVDVPLMFFCCVTTALALLVDINFNSKWLAILGFISGLAVSCKYNGAPIALLPMALVLLSRDRRTLKNFLFAAVTPVLGFLAGSPYILVSLPLFYQQLSYEAWHYAVAGHEGHMAEPGIAQVIHYGRWLASDGIGLGAALLSVVGTVLLFARKPRQAVIFGLFPALFFALMCAQRANFVRNMIPIIPYFAVLASYFAATLLEKYLDRAVLFLFYGALTVLVVCEPLLTINRMRTEILTFSDSRNELEHWVDTAGEKEIAIAGNLEPQRTLRERSGVGIIDGKSSIDDLFQDGFDYFITPAYIPAPTGQLSSATLINEIPGVPEDQRVPKNPAIRIYELKRSDDSTKDLSILPIPLGKPLGIDPEKHTWISKRVSLLAFDLTATKDTNITLQFTLMSPWKDQQIELIGKNWRQAVLLNQKNPGEWIPVSVRVPLKAFVDGNQLVLVVTKVSSPASHHLSDDQRRLAVAVQRVDRIDAQ